MPREAVFDKDEVIAKAKDVFWLKGFNATSMQDLVDVTGLNRSSIYNSFGSKMNLFQLTLKKYEKEGSGFFEVLIHSKLNGLQTISAVFENTLDLMIGDYERKGCMMINCSTEMGNQDLQLNNITAKNQKLLVGYFDEMVKKGQLDGSISTEQKSDELASYLTSAFQGFRITGMNTKNRKILVSIIENVLTTLE